LQWVFQRVQHVLAQVHLLESFQEQNVCRTSIVYEDFSNDPSSYVYLDDHVIIVNRGFQFEILFSESDWHLGPFWSGSWTVIDDGVHRPEIIVSLLLGFEPHGRSS
jgi:hypothetical protein